MGQYYHPINIDTQEFIYSHDFGNGLKLMEHSYMQNNFVQAVVKLLSPKGQWHKSRFVWAGDYMDGALFCPEGTPKKDKDNYDITLYSIVEKNVVEENSTAFLETLPKAGSYLTNHTKKICLNLKKEDAEGVKWDEEAWTIHPLPLLTCSGNGRGGGDYHGNHMGIVGCWAGDVISVEYKKIDGYKLVAPVGFIEGDEEDDLPKQNEYNTIHKSEKEIEAEKEKAKKQAIKDAKKAKLQAEKDAKEAEKQAVIETEKEKTVEANRPTINRMKEIYPTI